MFIIRHVRFAYVICNAVIHIRLFVIMFIGISVILNITRVGFIYFVYVMCFFVILVVSNAIMVSIGSWFIFAMKVFIHII